MNWGTELWVSIGVCARGGRGGVLFIISLRDPCSLGRKGGREGGTGYRGGREETERSGRQEGREGKEGRRGQPVGGREGPAVSEGTPPTLPFFPFNFFKTPSAP